MPEGHQFLANLALVLGTAGVATVVCRRLRLPVIFGYIVAGMILGPYVPIPLAADEEMVKTLSELGVILLMFALGLEFSLRRLFRIGPTAGVVAVLQSSALVAIGYLIGRAFGWTPLESVFAGAIIAISSTTIIVKAFHEQKVSGKFTEVVFGILIIEDLIAILLLTMLTTFALSGDVTMSLLAGTTGKLALFLVALIVIGLLVTPRFIRYLVGLDSPEMTVVVCVAICFATSYLASSAGYSVALGAFLAGAVIAESGKAEEITHVIEPVRDLFAAIFFVSVGMLIQPSLVAEYWIPIVVTTVAVIVGKVVAVSVGCFLTGISVRSSVRSGMSLAQIGEFSFIIAGVGLSTGATRPFLYPLAVAVSAITTLTTPWLIRLADPVASFVDRRLPAPLQTIVGLYGSWMQQLREPREPQPGETRRRRVALILVFDAVVLAGLGVGLWLGIGNLAEAVRARIGISAPGAWIAVLTVAIMVGTPFAVGLVRNLRTLIQLAALKALPAPAKGKVDLALAPRRALMVTWQLSVVVLVGVPLVALAEPIVPISISALALVAVLGVLGFVFWRTAANLQGHAKAGAEVIVAALERELAVPAGSRGGGLAPPGSDQRSLSNVYSMIPGLGEPVSVRIGPEDYAAGKALGEIDLRDLTGATVLVIARGTENVVLPIGRDVIQAGDVLALAGPADAVAAARELLVSGPAEDAGG